MLCYASLLIELGYVDEIELSFLVVGHTHCYLDQQFSVYSKKIYNSPFINSPMAMRALVGVAHANEKLRPLYNEHCQVFFYL